MYTPKLIARVLDHHRARQASRRELLSLQRDLAQYRTPAERAELAAIIARSDIPEDSDVWSVLPV